MFIRIPEFQAWFFDTVEAVEACKSMGSARGRGVGCTRGFGVACTRGARGSSVHVIAVNVSKLKEVSHEMLVLRLPRVSS